MVYGAKGTDSTFSHAGSPSHPSLCTATHRVKQLQHLLGRVGGVDVLPEHKRVARLRAPQAHEAGHLLVQALKLRHVVVLDAVQATQQVLGGDGGGAGMRG